jgi:hypothetical protein
MRKVLVDFVKQYSVRLIVCLALSIALLMVFTNTYKVPDSGACNQAYSIATSLQTGVINECKEVSTFSKFINNILPLLLIIAIIAFVALLASGVKIQVIHRKPWSWIRIFIYVFYGTILAIALSSNTLKARVIALVAGCIVGLTILALFIVYRHKRDALLNDTFHYGSGTIGRDGDVLGFSDAADNFRAGLLNLGLPVRVIGITGGMGEGKSTFWRLIAEGFEKQKTLHTYLSLTETNSTIDFSVCREMVSKPEGSIPVSCYY